MRHFCLGLIAFSAPLAFGGEPPGKLALETPSEAHLTKLYFTIGGPVGDRFQRNIDNWLLPAPVANPGMIEMFRQRDRKPEPQIVPWAGEFVGKYLISAIQSYNILTKGDHVDLFPSLCGTVNELIATQAEDGYLGPFPKRDRLLGNWDLWGHYHVIQALLLWYEEEGDEQALAAAVRAGDLICRTFLDTGRRAFDAGSQEMNLAVIHALGMLYRKTGTERYLRMMLEIEKDWERAGDYFRQGLAGVEFYRTPRPRWESLHDLQGLVELYRITGDERYKKAFVNLWRSIRRLDRHNTGGFSSGEQAVGNPYSPAPIETCCTVAWMAITVDMLRLTGDSAAADELELSTLNAALGAQHPSGRWWTYNTPMDGVRESSAHSIVFQARAGTPELNCCSVNGPRSLGMLSEWAVMVDDEGPILNYYGPLQIGLELKDGTAFFIGEDTTYPFENRVEIFPFNQREKAVNLRLRIPGWSRETRVTLPDGKVETPPPGRYFSILRKWGTKEKVIIHFDFGLRTWAGDREASGKVSLFRGPILLAWDQRWNPFDEDSLPSLDARALAGLEVPVETQDDGPLAPWLLVKLPGAKGGEIRLCDFASAGATGIRYRSWLPAVNLPPPPVVLDRPRDGEKIPKGKALFTWGSRRRPKADLEYAVLFSRSSDFSAQTLQATSRTNHLVLEKEIEPGRDVFWKVVARNANGAAESEARSFQIDPGLPPIPESSLAALEPGPGGLLLAAPDEVSLDGEKDRIRLDIPWFPGKDCTVAVRVAPRKFPEGRIAQVFSAWARGMDDPLRITIDGGKVFARIEAAGKSFSTEGVLLKLNEWVHVAAVKSGPKLTLYVNGEERSSAAVPEEVDSEAQNVGLGGNPNYGGNEFLAAAMKDFALYARALSAEEVRKLAKGEK